MNFWEELEQLGKDRKLRELDDIIDPYHQMIATYSLFDDGFIGDVIAHLIGTFEGIDYVYQDTHYYKTETKQLAFDKEETKIETRIRLIVAEKDKSRSYSEGDINLLVKKEELLS